MEQQKTEVLNSIGVDLSVTLTRFLENEDFYLRMIGKFLNDPSYASLEKDLSEKDFESAFSAAHTLKGVTANMGFSKLLEKVIPLTEELRNPPYDEELIGALFTDVKAEYQFTTDKIKEIV